MSTQNNLTFTSAFQGQPPLTASFAAETSFNESVRVTFSVSVRNQNPLPPAGPGTAFRGAWWRTAEKSIPSAESLKPVRLAI